ncbi:MAG TPA: amidohydrolase family protein [Candidatus Udaeobacter sp.]|nr:amidohydrolase family protein [Candidatus Udaeobacter sp.]
MAYVDCDSHILPDDAFDEVPAEYRHEGPRIETDPQGKSCVVYPARQRNIPDYARFIPNPFNPRPRSSGNRPEIRIADMAKANIDIQVLVPSNGAFYYDVEPQLAASVCRSYNNAVSRIVKKYSGKFIGLATLPLQEPSVAVKELDRAVRQLGLHGPVCYNTVKDKDLDAEEFWPFYAKAEELEVPIIFHPVNTGPIVGGWRMTRHYATRGYGFWSALGNSMENSLTIANLMFGGVLDAFPKLRFCFMEGGGTQVPHLMEGLAAIRSGEGDYDRLQSKPKREPLEYLDQLYFSVRTTENLLGVLVDRLGKNSWVVGTDYPHADTMGSWPNTVAVIQSREDLSSEAKDAILGGNALRLFGLTA